MEINELLKDVKHIDQYISATKDLNKFKQIQFNVDYGTVGTLKNMLSLEIEYFNISNKNGIACVMFEGLLTTPPSKAWGSLAKELVYVLQYWLKAIMKPVNRSYHRWMFLKLILKFIKEIRLKNPSIPNMLVQLTAECLFDLVTSPWLDVNKNYEVMQCLIIITAESSSLIRITMQNTVEKYIVKIAAKMLTSGYLPIQYAALNCLVHWLTLQADLALRAAAAERWLPESMCPQTAKNLFLNSSWINFYEDARLFLNNLNEQKGLVKSVVCKKLSIGDIDVIKGTEKKQSWLDFNSVYRSISVLLDPLTLEVFGINEHNYNEILLVDYDNTETAILHRDSLGLTISIHTYRPPLLRPSDLRAGTGLFLTVVVSSRTNLRALDWAMGNTFGNKYKRRVELDTDISQSTQRSYENLHESNAKADTGVTAVQPGVEVKRRNLSGYTRMTKDTVKASSSSTASTSSLIQNADTGVTAVQPGVEVKRRNLSGYTRMTKDTVKASSSSTASTSSLIQLKHRLAALPRYKMHREPVSVCVQPVLSNITELTEPDDGSTNISISDQFLHYGVCHKHLETSIDHITECKSRSEGETVRQKIQEGRLHLSPVVSDDNSISLTVAKGSTNNSVINQTSKRLLKSKDFRNDNILVQEDVYDSCINTDEKKIQESEVIEDTPMEIRRVSPKKVCKYVSKSTTDGECNTEAINETPAYVNTKKVLGKYNPKPIEAERTYNLKSVEESKSKSEISQHIVENQVNRVKRNITLKDEPIKKPKTPVTKNAEQKKIAIVSTILEQTGKVTIPEEVNPASEMQNMVNLNDNAVNPETPCIKGIGTVIRRKLKLYSPISDNNIDKEVTVNDFTDSDDAPLSEIKSCKYTNTAAVCYKKLERERKIYTRVPKSGKNNAKNRKMLSPRTIKMNSMFDTTSNENITPVDENTAVFDFTSENEDDDLEKIVRIKKRVNTKSVVKNGRNTRPNIETGSSSEEIKVKPKPMKATKRTIEKNTKTKVRVVDLVGDKLDLVDEQNRDAATEQWNNSFVNGQHIDLESIEGEPVLTKRRRRMEEVHDESSPVVKHVSKSNDTLLSNTTKELTYDSASNDAIYSKRKTTKRAEKADVLQLNDDQSNTLSPTKKVNKRVNKKTEKGLATTDKALNDKDDDITISPLPNLVVESMPKQKEDVNDSLTNNMLQKYKRIYKDGPEENVDAEKQKIQLKTTQVRNEIDESMHFELLDIPSITMLIDSSPIKSATRKCTITDFEESSDRNTHYITKRSVSKELPISVIQSSNIESSSEDECIKNIRCIFSKVGSPKSRKRKSTSPICDNEKKKRREKLDISESGPSTSHTSRRDNTYCKDSIIGILEQLHTTLVESNQTTSKMYVNLFVEVEKQLSQQKDEYHQMMKQEASKLITTMMSLMDKAFTEIDKKSQEMNTNVIEKLKQQASDFILDDFGKKQAMVLLLKEKFQALLDDIDRNSTDSQ